MNLTKQEARLHLHSDSNFTLMNRTELQAQLIEQMLDDMDLKTMTQLCYDFMNDSYNLYSDDELVAEVNDYYPELMEVA